MVSRFAAHLLVQDYFYDPGTRVWFRLKINLTHPAGPDGTAGQSATYMT